MSTTPASLSATVDPHSALLAQRRLECEDYMRGLTVQYEPGTYCEAHFDGWSCIPLTLAGEIALIPCPPMLEFDTSRYAHKICESDASWFRHPFNNRSWTNYTTCIDVQDFELRRQINLIYITGYTISLIAILFSISIFCYFRYALLHAIVELVR